MTYERTPDTFLRITTTTRYEMTCGDASALCEFSAEGEAVNARGSNDNKLDRENVADCFAAMCSALATLTERGK